MLQVRPEETAGRDIKGRGKSLTLVTPKRRQGEHREIFAFNQSNANRGLACRLPRHARLGVQPLGEVDELDEFVALLRING